jgi:hypothetical protein
MNRFLFSCIGGITMSFTLSAQVQEICATEESEVLDGEYIISNNVWGGGSGVGDQCLEIYPDSTFFEVTLSTHDDDGVCSYPFIFKGCHWGHCTQNSNLPIQINEIKSAPFTWVINREGVSGTWNAAFEAWFDPTGSGYDYTGELMVWINYGGGASPGGSKVGEKEIGGYLWDVFYAEWQFNYTAYRIKSVIDSISVDFREFINDAMDRGYIEESWYMHNMEAGFEIWRNGQGLTTLSYSAAIEEGIYTGDMGESYIKSLPPGLKQNYPNPFSLSTKISYLIPESDYISLKIYDIYGREIRVLVNNYQHGGFYSVILDAGALNDGIYFYKLQTGKGLAEIRKMIILNYNSNS